MSRKKLRDEKIVFGFWFIVNKKYRVKELQERQVASTVMSDKDKEVARCKYSDE